MKKISYSFLVLSLCLGTTAFSQSWVNLMNKKTSTVHDVQQAFNTWYAQEKSHLTSSNSNADEDEVGGYSLYKRWEWFMQSRTYPSGNLPDFNKIANDYQTYVTNQAAHNTHRAAATANWTYVGNTSVVNNGGDGRVNRLRFMPGNPNTIFACCPTGGLWKSTNGGTTWSTSTDQIPDLAVSDVAIDPANTNIMYISTGDGDGIGGGYTTLSTIGVLKSTDGGTTWNPTGLYLQQANTGLSLSTTNQLLLNPANPNIILAATSFGLYYTSNAGVAWNMILAGNFKSLEFEPNHTSTVYAATANGLFYRSTDMGASWTNITSGLPATNAAGRMQIAVTPADSNYVYVLACDPNFSGFYGVYLSTDRGQTFAAQSTAAGGAPNLLGWSPTGNDFGGQGWYTLSLAASPTNKDSIIVGGVDIWKSSDAGVTWTLNGQWTGTGAPYVHADIHCLAFNPTSGGSYFAATDGGVFKDLDGDLNWADYSNNLEISEQYSIGPSGLTPGFWISGWQDNGCNVSGSPWSQVLGGDGMVAFIDYSNDNNLYAENYQGDFQLSTDGGATWNGITTGINGNAPWVTQWMQDPKNANTIYGGYSDLWISTNQGTSWTQSTTFATTSNSVSAIAVDFKNDNYLAAAQPGQMMYTTNGGTSWTDVTSNLPVSVAGISGIAISSNTPSHMWVTFSGYTDTAKVFYSNNGGTSWTNISAGLPNLPVNCIVYQNSSPESVYIGTDCGVYYRDSNTKSWARYGAGLPNVIINQLQITRTDNKLIAATYGRGTWEADLYTPPALAPVTYFNAFPRKICAGDTVLFTDSTANQPSSWAWTFAGGSPASSTAQNPVVVYNTPGTYSVQLISGNVNGNNTLSMPNYITVYALPPVPTLSQSGDTLFCTPSNEKNYQWYDSYGAINGATSYRYTIKTTSTYTVTITDSNGCSSANTILGLTVGLNEVSANEFVNIYPNPTAGNVSISFNLPKDGTYNLSITNVVGQQLVNQQVHLTANTTRQVNMAGYGSGVYFLTLKGNGMVAQKKIIVY